MELLATIIVSFLKLQETIRINFKKLYYILFKKLFDYAFLKFNGVDTKYGYVNLIGLPIIQKNQKSSIKIGPNVTLVSKSMGNIAGINHPVILSTLRENSFINIEGPFGASGSAIIAAIGITIQANTGLGANSKVYDTDFHNVNPNDRLKSWNNLNNSKEIIIGKNVWIGANCIILKGASIGHNSVIGAGSVLTKVVPDNCLYAGNPAKKIKDFNYEQ